jgi:hypothetical protein
MDQIALHSYMMDHRFGVVIPESQLLRKRVAVFFRPGAIVRHCLQGWPALSSTGTRPFRLGFRHARAGLCFQAGTDVNEIIFVSRLIVHRGCRQWIRLALRAAG